jgi:pyruvate/2-oxoglutarate dehydrogenase complex dihydrolipoamide dehydrogenase (E3) component
VPVEPVRVEPFDDLNRSLVANVHPGDWVNPSPKERYHLVVIGAGTGGLVSAAIAAGLGARVALIERHLMGGDCLNVGCVPSKGMIAGARAWHAGAEAAATFGGPHVAGTGSFGEVMARMRRLRAGLSGMDSAARFHALGVDVFLGDGRFVGPDAVTVDGRTLRFRRAIIATGARPAMPTIAGLGEAGALTNETVFGLTELPRRLIVLGGGPVACELGQAFARLGSEVTLVTAGSRILPRDDADAARLVERAMEANGVRVLRDARATRAERRGGARVLQVEHAAGSVRLEADELLVAAGRAPTVEGLGLDQAGVRYSPGGITVNDRLRTSNPRIYAVGDVCSRHRFTHAADAQARIAVPNALFYGLGGGRASRLVIPWTTYTTPEVARVGMHEEEARAAGLEPETFTIPLEVVDRAVLDGEACGFFRVHVRRGSDCILGATLVARHAGEMIGEVVLAMTAGLGIAAIGAAIHPYPTQAEIFRKAADAWRRTKLTPRARGAFRAFFRLAR